MLVTRSFDQRKLTDSGQNFALGTSQGITTPSEHNQLKAKAKEGLVYINTNEDEDRDQKLNQPKFKNPREQRMEKLSETPKFSEKSRGNLDRPEILSNDN